MLRHSRDFSYRRNERDRDSPGLSHPSTPLAYWSNNVTVLIPRVSMRLISTYVVGQWADFSNDARGFVASITACCSVIT
jgi:hypothetical protein